MDLMDLMDLMDNMFFNMVFNGFNQRLLLKHPKFMNCSMDWKSFCRKPVFLVANQICFLLQMVHCSMG